MSHPRYPNIERVIIVGEIESGSPSNRNATIIVFVGSSSRTAFVNLIHFVEQIIHVVHHACTP